MPPGFDLGNSPYEASRADLAGKTIIQRTSAGTQGIVAAKQATQLYAGSLLTATATTRAIRKHSPQQVTLVAMGLDGRKNGRERTRTSCARSICATCFRDGKAACLVRARSSLRDRKSLISRIPPSRIFIPATWTLHSTSTATTSPSASYRKMAGWSRGRSRPRSKSQRLKSMMKYQRPISPSTTFAACSSPGRSCWSAPRRRARPTS